ncbi:MAG: hypothetical protein KC466_05620, partial [Myxococcales bacterium]|nr:hypothetical protein [Myxococcales bacterium]
DKWCTPTLMDEVNSSSCFDNDPHLTAGGTSIYFDSNRDAADCFKLLAKDWHVYHSQIYCDASGNWGQGDKDHWCPPVQVVGGPNIPYIARDTYPGTTLCSTCANCPSPSDCPETCPLYCAPRELEEDRPADKARQAFMTDHESLTLFTGKVGDCVPDPSKRWKETVASNTGLCIYASRRAETDYELPNSGGRTVPTWEPPFLVARPQPSDARPCRGGSDTDIGKIVGLGEPSMSKDGRLLYFGYIRKTVAGTPLTTPSLCTSSSPDPSDPNNPLCRCDMDSPVIAPDGCWMPWCNDPDFVGTPVADSNCREECNDEHIAGTDENNNDCLPLSVLYCAHPEESQATSVPGVDVSEFGIGRARREHWDVSIGVVEAQ